MSSLIRLRIFLSRASFEMTERVELWNDNLAMKKGHTYYVYIIANPSRSVIYIGMTNSLTRRLQEHKQNRGCKRSFAGRHYCYELVYYEVYQYVNEAIAREKQLKKWSRIKKDALIKSQNPLRCS